MQAPRTDVCNLGATAGFYMISNSKSGRPKNSSCASLFCCCHALVLKYRSVQLAGIKTAESMSDAVQGLSNVRRSRSGENTNVFSSREGKPKGTRVDNQSELGGFLMNASMFITAVAVQITSRCNFGRLVAS